MIQHKTAKIYVLRLQEKLKVSNNVAQILMLAKDDNDADMRAKIYFKKNQKRYEEYSVAELPSFTSTGMVFLPDNIHNQPFLTF